MSNWNQISDGIDQEMVSVLDELPLWSAPFGLKLLETIKLRPNINVLDIGSGTGFPLLEIAQRIGTSSKVFGIDPWELVTERTKLKIEKYKVKNVEIIIGKSENLPFPDNYFELIVSNNGINNVDDIKQTLMECYRVSKVGCQFTLSLNLPGTMQEFYDVYEQTLSGLGKKNEIRRMKEHIDQKRKPLNQILELLSNTGFKIKTTDKDSFRMKFINGTAMLNHYSIRNFFSVPWKEILNPDDINKIFNQLEKKLNSLSEKQGELVLSIPFVIIDCVKN